jgi:heparosan-N-sulfate-glucuronate 5-epimerase
MPIKEINLLVRDITFYFTGKADVSEANWRQDPWLYPLDWTYQLDREADYFMPKDEAGIPLRDFPGSLGKQYLVSRIAGYGFAHWNRSCSSDSSTLNHTEFLKIAQWFSRVPQARYEHHFPIAGMKLPWISCISQGEAASILSRAFIRTGDRAYLAKARQALAPFQVLVDGGGLRSTLPDGQPFLEEYPGTEYRHVLNGCLYALVGLNDYIRAAGEEGRDHRPLFDSLIEAVASNLAAWNVNGWSVYDYQTKLNSSRNLNTMTYQILQAVFLEYLNEMKPDPRLNTMYEAWKQNAGRLPRRLGAFSRKMTYRLTAGW